jgi:hypothetical protein
MSEDFRGQITREDVEEAIAALEQGRSTRLVRRFSTTFLKAAGDIRRLQTLRLLHVCSGRFRLERSPGGACTHWKSAALSRRTW